VAIVTAGLDVHGAQITFGAPDQASGELVRGTAPHVDLSRNLRRPVTPAFRSCRRSSPVGCCVSPRMPFISACIPDAVFCTGH
jgi:microcystin degradation protein MlrC